MAQRHRSLSNSRVNFGKTSIRPNPKYIVYKDTARKSIRGGSDCG